MSPATPLSPELEYPESDGKPIADNTLQFRHITTIKGGLDALFRDRPDVFVAGDLFWHPVEGRPDLREAPDVLVAFGRPRGDRGSYMQWREEGIAPQVVFEVLSPNNRIAEMVEKFLFYQRHGVEEYYLYDPDTGELSGWIREGGELVPIAGMQGWTSPLLGVQFEVQGKEMRLYGPDGRPFLSYEELAAERDRAEAERDRLAARLRELGIDPDL